MDITKTPLMVYLRANGDTYYGKVLELKESVSKWLSYIPHTFPHYTRHTVEHSDEIVRQMSKLLFRSDEPAQPAVRLSAAEAYIAIAGAYLHDAGMVASDSEKVEILKSEEWKEWVTGTGSGAERWNAVQDLRSGSEPQEPDLRYFLADIQTRFLLAEFIRRTHQVRASNLIAQHQGMLGRFAFDDPILLRAISNVCIGHGLRQHELEDRERYPDECDIRDERVNVRFLAILLRLGDLLDMSSDRACPLLLNAASPIPSESLAHWSQYQRITHRLTSPDRIEIRAECLTQEEHRVLRDWCQWLVNEVKDSRALMRHARRHGEWLAPNAELSGAGATIHIGPASCARYFPSEWRFELDSEVVFGLLIKDVYESTDVFIRELVQNALDANRCQMYLDLSREGPQPPEYPSEVSEEQRLRYPVHVSIAARPVTNELSGEPEVRQFVVVEDCGIGMDSEIIQKYFLQVGRSYYVTDEFQRKFRFVPTSRFGIGFLTVFAVSDRIVVETFKPSSPRQDGPIRLTLTGPRNYLLTEHGDRRRQGTRIELMLRQSMAEGALTRLVGDWCRRVEFPILVDDFGKTSTIRAEQATEFVREEPDPTNPGARFLVRSFPIESIGLTGDLYIFGYTDQAGESWAYGYGQKGRHPETHPQASIPSVPPLLTCLHGITVPGPWRLEYGSSFSFRIDVRRAGYPTTLGRNRARGTGPRENALLIPPEVTKVIQDVVSKHIAETPLAASESAWHYKQCLMDGFPLSGPYWADMPATVRVTLDRRVRLQSIAELRERDSLTLVIPVRWSRYTDSPDTESWTNRLLGRVPVLGEVFVTCYDLLRMSRLTKFSLFGDCVTSTVRFISNTVLAFTLAKVPQGDCSPCLFQSHIGKLRLVSFPTPQLIGFDLPFPGDTLLNSGNSLVQWYLKVKLAAEHGEFGLTKEGFAGLSSLLMYACKYPHDGTISELRSHLAVWRELKDLPAEMYPPQTNLSVESFYLQPRRPRRPHHHRPGPGLGGSAETRTNLRF